MFLGTLDSVPAACLVFERLFIKANLRAKIHPALQQLFARGLRPWMPTWIPTSTMDSKMGAWPFHDATANHMATEIALAAWAWGLSRALDVLARDQVDGERVMVVGHSRMGKAAWAGATDELFAMVFSNN